MKTASFITHSVIQPLGNMPRALRTILQVGIIGVIWLIASGLTHALKLQMSAGVIGLILVLVLLFSGRGTVAWFADGANWLLGELTLFFIPCVVAVVKYSALFKAQGLQLVFVIAVGTVMVMISTAWAVHLACRLEQRLEQRRQNRLVQNSHRMIKEKRHVEF